MSQPFQDLRIVFMGTPEFAVASLDALLEAGAQIVGVVTAPDKPAGRGLQLSESAVKKYALEKGLPILQPEKLKSPEFLTALSALQPDLQVVVAFRMLPEIVWDLPPMGTINLHGSLLPQYRGAAPINWAILNGERETGVTTFKLQHAIDTGNILLQEKFPLGPEETAGELHDRMKTIGAHLLVRTVQGLAAGDLEAQPQPSVPGGDAALKHAPKIFTEHCRIDWNRSRDHIFNQVRGLAPFPGAFTELNGKILKIWKAKKESGAPSIRPGTLQTDQKTFLKFTTPDGFILPTEVQLEGKKKMGIEEFLRGYRVLPAKD